MSNGNILVTSACNNEATSKKISSSTSTCKSSTTSREGEEATALLLTSTSPMAQMDTSVLAQSAAVDTLNHSGTITSDHVATTNQGQDEDNEETMSNNVEARNHDNVQDAKDDQMLKSQPAMKPFSAAVAAGVTVTGNTGGTNNTTSSNLSPSTPPFVSSNTNYGSSKGSKSNHKMTNNVDGAALVKMMNHDRDEEFPPVNFSPEDNLDTTSKVSNVASAPNSASKKGGKKKTWKPLAIEFQNKPLNDRDIRGHARSQSGRSSRNSNNSGESNNRRNVPGGSVSSDNNDNDSQFRGPRRKQFGDNNPGSTTAPIINRGNGRPRGGFTTNGPPRRGTPTSAPPSLSGRSGSGRKQHRSGDLEDSMDSQRGGVQPQYHHVHHLVHPLQAFISTPGGATTAAVVVSSPDLEHHLMQTSGTMTPTNSNTVMTSDTNPVSESTVVANTTFPLPPDSVAYLVHTLPDHHHHHYVAAAAHHHHHHHAVAAVSSSNSEQKSNNSISTSATSSNNNNNSKQGSNLTANATNGGSGAGNVSRSIMSPTPMTAVVSVPDGYTLATAANALGPVSTSNLDYYGQQAAVVTAPFTTFTAAGTITITAGDGTVQVVPAVIANPAPQVAVAPIDPQSLKIKIRTQIEYYFSEENLSHDVFMRRKMDEDGYLAISLIASFHRVANLTSDIQLIIESLEKSSLVQLSENHLKARAKNNPKKWPILENTNPESSPAVTMANASTKTETNKTDSTNSGLNSSPVVTNGDETHELSLDMNSLKVTPGAKDDETSPDCSNHDCDSSKFNSTSSTSCSDTATCPAIHNSKSSSCPATCTSCNCIKKIDVTGDKITENGHGNSCSCSSSPCNCSSPSSTKKCTNSNLKTKCSKNSCSNDTFVPNGIVTKNGKTPEQSS